MIRDKRGEDEEEGSEMTDKSDLAARAFWPCQLCPPLLVIILPTNIIMAIIFLTISILVIILVTDTIPLKILTLKNNFKVFGDDPQFWLSPTKGRRHFDKGMKLCIFETLHNER